MLFCEPQAVHYSHLYRNQNEHTGSGIVWRHGLVSVRKERNEFPALKTVSIYFFPIHLIRNSFVLGEYTEQNIKVK